MSDAKPDLNEYVIKSRSHIKGRTTQDLQAALQRAMSTTPMYDDSDRESDSEYSEESPFMSGQGYETESDSEEEQGREVIPLSALREKKLRPTFVFEPITSSSRRSRKHWKRETLSGVLEAKITRQRESKKKMKKQLRAIALRELKKQRDAKQVLQMKKKRRSEFLIKLINEKNWDDAERIAPHCKNLFSKLASDKTYFKENSIKSTKNNDFRGKYSWVHKLPKYPKKRVQNLVRDFCTKLTVLVKTKEDYKRAQSRLACEKGKLAKQRKGFKFAHRRNGGGKGKKTGIMYGINKNLEAAKKAQSKRDKLATRTSLETIRKRVPERRSAPAVKPSVIRAVRKPKVQQVVIEETEEEKEESNALRLVVFNHIKKEEKEESDDEDDGDLMQLAAIKGMCKKEDKIEKRVYLNKKMKKEEKSDKKKTKQKKKKKQQRKKKILDLGFKQKESKKIQQLKQRQRAIKKIETRVLEQVKMTSEAKIADGIKKSCTKVCKSVFKGVQCAHGESCRFAHTKQDQLEGLKQAKRRKACCAYGLDCKMVSLSKQDGKYKVVNKRSEKKCCEFLHSGTITTRDGTVYEIDETAEQAVERIWSKMPKKKQPVKKEKKVFKPTSWKMGQCWKKPETKPVVVDLTKFAEKKEKCNTHTGVAPPRERYRRRREDRYRPRDRRSNNDRPRGGKIVYTKKPGKWTPPKKEKKIDQDGFQLVSRCKKVKPTSGRVRWCRYGNRCNRKGTCPFKH